jgi:hypothetical protein
VRLTAPSLVVLIAVVAGCGGNKQQSQQIATGPGACLKNAGLINVQRRGGALWIADNEAPFFGVSVGRFVTPDDASQFVAEQESVGNSAAQAGRYAVTGPGKADVDNQCRVAAVAFCLRR